MVQIIGNNNYVLRIENNSIKEPIFLENGKAFISNHGEVIGTSIEDLPNTKELFKYIKNNTSFDLDIEELPIKNEEVIKDKFYKYNNEIIICRQTHKRTIYGPKDTPALFSFYREDDGELEWIENEWVNIDDIRIYKNNKYKCIQSHTTLKNSKPDITSSLWVKQPDIQCPEWKQPTGAHDAYKKGDCIVYKGNRYESLIGSNVWNPDIYTGGWKLINNT